MLQIRREGAFSKAEIGLVTQFPDYVSAYSFGELVETAVEEGQEKGEISKGIGVKSKIDFSGAVRIEINYSPTIPEGNLASPEKVPTGGNDLELIGQILSIDLDSLSQYRKAANERRAYLDYSFPETAKKEETERALFGFEKKIDLRTSEINGPNPAEKEIVLVLPGKYDRKLSKLPALEKVAKKAAEETNKGAAVNIFSRTKVPGKKALKRTSSQVNNFTDTWYFALESSGSERAFGVEDVARKAFATSLEMALYASGLYDELGCYYVDAIPFQDSIKITISGEKANKRAVEKKVREVVSRARKSAPKAEWKIVRTYLKGAGAEEFEYYLPSDRLIHLGRDRRGETTNAGPSERTIREAERRYCELSLGEEVGKYSIVPARKAAKNQGRKKTFSREPSEETENITHFSEERKKPREKSVKRKEYRAPNGALIIETHSNTPGLVGAGIVFSGAGCVYGAMEGSANLTHLQEHLKLRKNSGTSNFQDDGISEGVHLHAYTEADEMTFHLVSSHKYRRALLDLAGEFLGNISQTPNESLLELERNGMKTELRSIGAEVEPAERIANNISFGYEKSLREELSNADWVTADDISRWNARLNSGNATVVGMNLSRKDLLEIAGNLRKGRAHQTKEWHMRGKRAAVKSRSSYPLIIECAEIPVENEASTRVFLETVNHNALKTYAVGEGFDISTSYTKVGKVVQVQTSVSGTGDFKKVKELYESWVSLRKEYGKVGVPTVEAEEGARRLLSEINCSGNSLSGFYGELSARGGKRKIPGRGQTSAADEIPYLNPVNITEGGKVYNSSRRRAVVEGRPY